MKKLMNSKYLILKSYFVGIFRIILIAIMARRQKPGISPGFQSGAMPTTEDVRFVYDQWGHLIAEYNPAGMQWNLKREYVNDSNGVVCTLEYDGEEYERGFHLKDHLGSTRVLCTDQAAALYPGYSYKMQIVWSGDYEAFGRPAPERSICPGAWENPIRYTGYYYDGALFEHYYAQARYYDPYTGRFLSRDPDRFEFDQAPTTANRYPYCANNPVHFVDPTGRFFFLPLLLAGAELGFGVGSAIVLDFFIGGITQTILHPEAGLEDVITSGLRTVVADLMLLASVGIYNQAVQAAEAAGEAVGAAAKLGLVGSILDYGRYTTLNLGNAQSFGHGYAPEAIHHGLGGLIFGMGSMVGGSIIWGITSVTLSLDDFIQHFAQVVTGNPDIHSVIHNLYAEFQTESIVAIIGSGVLGAAELLGWLW
jgi:RHS repeat-associated protein